jgi:hypothetical protein
MSCFLVIRTRELSMWLHRPTFWSLVAVFAAAALAAYAAAGALLLAGAPAGGMGQLPHLVSSLAVGVAAAGLSATIIF